jgi:tetratricopeptide (TPR) repeat protein
MIRLFAAGALIGGVLLGSARAVPAKVVAGREHIGTSTFQQTVQHLRAGRYMAAAKGARLLIRRGASTPAPRAVMGIALARQELYADALPHLYATQGTLPYTSFGGAALHADALRAAGRGREAWEMRQEGLGLYTQSKQMVHVLAAGLEDLLSISALEEAIVLGERAIEAEPGSSFAHAVLTRVLLAKGDLAQAEFHHWLSKLHEPNRVARIQVNQAGIAEAYGDVPGAAASWKRARKIRRSDVHIAALQVGWMRRTGRLEQATTVLEQKRWDDKQTPEICIETILVHLALQNTTAAQRAWERMANLFPEHPMTRLLEVEVES